MSPVLFLGVAGAAPALMGGPLTAPEDLRLGAVRLRVNPATATLTAPNKRVGEQSTGTKVLMTTWTLKSAGFSSEDHQ